MYLPGGYAAYMRVLDPLHVGTYRPEHHPDFRTPDALQLAAALSAGCRTFVTNDRDLPAVPGLEVLQLRSYL